MKGGVTLLMLREDMKFYPNLLYYSIKNIIKILKKNNITICRQEIKNKILQYNGILVYDIIFNIKQINNIKSKLLLFIIKYNISFYQVSNNYYTLIINNKNFFDFCIENGEHYFDDIKKIYNTLNKLKIKHKTECIIFNNTTNKDNFCEELVNLPKTISMLEKIKNRLIHFKKHINIF